MKIVVELLFPDVIRRRAVYVRRFVIIFCLSSLSLSNLDPSCFQITPQLKLFPKSDLLLQYNTVTDWQKKNNWFESSDSVSLFLFRRINQELLILRNCFEPKKFLTIKKQSFQFTDVNQETFFDLLIRNSESRNTFFIGCLKPETIESLFLFQPLNTV